MPDTAIALQTQTKAILWVKERSLLLYSSARARPAVVLFTSSTFFTVTLSLFVLSLPMSRAVAEAPVAPAHTAIYIRPLEMHIANNGLVLLRSARVISIDSTTLVVSTSWGSVDFRWIVHTDAHEYETHQYGTRFIDQSGKKSALPNVHIGSLVTITGMLDSQAQELSILADSVRILQ